MEENKHIKLPLGTVSLSPELGSYYIDMRPAKIHYQPNIWGGDFDQNGVPRISFKGELGYFPINIAQYGFMLHAEWLETGNIETLELMKSCLNVLEEIKTENNDHCVWWHNEINYRYNIEPPWASAMAQGELISFYLRMYQILGETDLLNTALKSYEFMRVNVSEGGVRQYSEDLGTWLEEYPSDPPSFVLNGFIYAIFGIYDLYRVTRNELINEDLQRLLNTVKNNLSKFDAGFWSYYDLQKKELVRYYYQKNVHIPQLNVLYQLTNEPVFLKYAEKWERQLTSINYLIVKIMYRVLPRVRKLKKLISF
ncbi:D-glucuronyl C5-epimerase family protein [Fulvivirga lutea]|uniref:D-glucuronyl C5-epimerase C-terminal domain-containing protein n=1 Tax=Fulvivirga lutea TaxID=2810512 RepID=A0A974WHW8_9BACT|nr:D-glucuronyl C5-epimerase family protein [Fulvivirga lutea]QSE98445.1 hypothetical protein JR347_05040 [Fulvivirga lutea]